MDEDIRDCQLYLISPEGLDAAAFASKLEAALAAVPGRVGAFQLRLPDADDATITAAAKMLQPICAEHGVAFFLSDVVSLVAPLRADGIHLEKSRKTIGEVRQMVGEDVVIGVSCGDSRDRAMQVGNDGADYVSFQVVHCAKPAGFASPEPAERRPSENQEIFRGQLENLRWWQMFFVLPCVAAGGVTLENAAELVAAGADFLALRGAVWEHPVGPGAAVKAFDAIITQALPIA